MTWQTIGFEKQKKFFAQILETAPPAGGLAHAYIFAGPEMIGKQMFARDLFVLANNREQFNQNDPDLRMVSPRLAEGETKIYIEDARDIKQFLSLKPYHGPYKFVIINDAERLTPEASNALLKALEEPVSNSVLILISSKLRILLPTIISRCQMIRFLSHSPKQSEEFLSNASASRRISKSDQQLLLAMAQGRIGWLANAIDQVSEIKKAIADLEKVLSGGASDRMLYAKKMYEKETYQATVTHWIYWLYANSQISARHNALKQLLTLATHISQPQYNHRLLLENALLDL